MENAINKGASTEGISRAPRSLRTAVVARLLAGTMALSAAALSACSSDELIVGPTLAGLGGDGGADGTNLPNDSTSTVDAASDTTVTTDGEVDMTGDATTVTADASPETLTSNTPDTAETVSSTDSSPDSVVADTILAVDVPTPVKDVASSVADTSNNSTDIVAEAVAADTTPSGPKQICEKKKAEIIAALKPGAPECSETIPGVGTKAGKLVCDGTNLKPNCEID